MRSGGALEQVVVRPLQGPRNPGSHALCVFGRRGLTAWLPPFTPWPLATSCASGPAASKIAASSSGVRNSCPSEACVEQREKLLASDLAVRVGVKLAEPRPAGHHARHERRPHRPVQVLAPDHAIAVPVQPGEQLRSQLPLCLVDARRCHPCPAARPATPSQTESGRVRTSPTPGPSPLPGPRSSETSARIQARAARVLARAPALPPGTKPPHQSHKPGQAAPWAATGFQISLIRATPGKR